MREAVYPEITVEKSLEISGQKTIEYLSWYKDQLDPFLKLFFEEKINEASKIHPEAVVLVEEVRRLIVQGGKRLRPAFAYAAYIAAGGRSHDAILYASASLELIQAFALIHDDIIDQSDLRRGEPSVHKVFEEFHKKRLFRGDAAFFGQSSAILAGDLALSYADELLNNSPFPSERIRRGKVYFDLMKSQVIFGEYLDVLASVKDKVSEDDILKILEFKTAKYTIERPMHVGATLAGAGEDLLEVFSAYAVPLGQAFQMQDDILGTFGEAEKIGKPTDSDIKEGKKTLLMIKALELSSQNERKFLLEVLGNPTASREQIEEVKKIIRKTGSLNYSLETSRKLIEKAKDSLEEASITQEGRNYLVGAADFLLTRELPH